MLIDDRNVVALPERVKLSPEREQNALRHQACSTARPCLADRPARRWRWLHPLMASGLVGWRNQHRCNRRACADAAGCDQRDGDQGTHPTPAVPTVPKERNPVQGSLLLACSRPPAARPWASTPRGSVMRDGGDAIDRHPSYLRATLTGCALHSLRRLTSIRDGTAPGGGDSLAHPDHGRANDQPTERRLPNQPSGCPAGLGMASAGASSPAEPFQPRYVGHGRGISPEPRRSSVPRPGAAPGGRLPGR
jgi:hypothetical protein